MRKLTFLILLSGASLTQWACGEGTHGVPNSNPAQTTGTRPFVENETPRPIELTLFDNDAETSQALEKRLLEKLDAEKKLQCPAEPSAAYEPCTGSGKVGELDTDEGKSTL